MFRNLSIYVLFYVWVVMTTHITTSTSSTTHIFCNIVYFLLWQHIFVKFPSVSMAYPPWPISICITSRAQSIFKQAMRRPLILFHVVSASTKRQYELFLAQRELSPPQPNRVRFSQGSHHSGDRSSLVGGAIVGSGPLLGFNNT